MRNEVDEERFRLLAPDQEPSCHHCGHVKGAVKEATEPYRVVHALETQWRCNACTMDNKGTGTGMNPPNWGVQKCKMDFCGRQRMLDHEEKVQAAIASEHGSQVFNRDGVFAELVAMGFEEGMANKALDATARSQGHSKVYNTDEALEWTFNHPDGGASNEDDQRRDAQVASDAAAAAKLQAEEDESAEERKRAEQARVANDAQVAMDLEGHKGEGKRGEGEGGGGGGGGGGGEKEAIIVFFCRRLLLRRRPRPPRLLPPLPLPSPESRPRSESDPGGREAPTARRHRRLNNRSMPRLPRIPKRRRNEKKTRKETQTA